MAEESPQLGVPDPEGDPRQQPGAEGSASTDEIRQILAGYKSEAEQARAGGPTGRDAIWSANWELYWGNLDYSDKAEWQSKEVMPEAPQFVDRWAAAMREALNQPGRWWSVEDPADQDRALVPHIEKFIELLLANAGRTPDGHPADFGAVFEDLMKLGALMAIGATVTWRAGDGPGGGQVAVEPTDPRTIWVDHTGRGLYRRRTYEIDKHELQRRAELFDGNEKPVYNVDAIASLMASPSEERKVEKEESTGHGQEQTSSRQPVTIDEWLATVVSNNGDVLAEDSLIVVANDREIVRGPEPNPFWHGRDWVILSPMVTVPLSVYGRSYMEDWASVARAFIEMTNLIMDGVLTSTMNAFAVVPSMLEDPTQLLEGIWPNKAFELEEGRDARQFLKEIQFGQLPPESITVWQGLKQEMREGAKLSEIALGQMPPKGDITATEVTAVAQSGSSVVRSMARTVEQRVLEQILTLVWQTGLQHVDFNDPQLQQELGTETTRMLAQRKEEFRTRQIRIRVNGISSLIDRQEKLRNLLSALQTIGQSEPLLQMFAQKYDFASLMDELLRLYGVDVMSLIPTERERKIRAIINTEQARQRAAEGGAAAAGPRRGTPAQARQGATQ